MFRRSLRFLASRCGLASTRAVLCTMGSSAFGDRERYRPRFRPRRLVMPVDISRLPRPFSPNEVQEGDLDGKLARLAADNARVLDDALGLEAVLKLGDVPKERTVGDLFRNCLTVCREKRFFDVREVDGFDGSATLAKHLKDQETQQQQGERRLADAREVRSGAANLIQHDASVAATLEATWNALNSLPLTAPAHGPLATRGRALVELTIVADLHAAFPRLRSFHADVVIQSTTTALPCAYVAAAIGLVHFCNVTTDAELFREHVTLAEKKAHVVKQLALHEGLVAAGKPHRLGHWRRQMARIHAARRSLPATPAELLPRAEWIRSMLFAFLGAVELGEGTAAAEILIRRLFLGGFSRQLWDETPDDHPLNKVSDRVAATRNSSNEVGAIPYSRPFAEKFEAPREYDDARTGKRYTVPPLLTYSLTHVHAFKEAQIIIKYDPSTPAAIRNAPLDFEKTADTLETVEAEASARVEAGNAAHDSVQAMRMRFFAGTTVLGEGTDQTIELAMQAAARHMLCNYYFKRSS